MYVHLYYHWMEDVEIKQSVVNNDVGGECQGECGSRSGNFAVPVSLKRLQGVHPSHFKRLLQIFLPLSGERVPFNGRGLSKFNAKSAKCYDYKARLLCIYQYVFTSEKANYNAMYYLQIII